MTTNRFAFSIENCTPVHCASPILFLKPWKDTWYISGFAFDLSQGKQFLPVATESFQRLLSPPDRNSIVCKEA